MDLVRIYFMYIWRAIYLGPVQTYSPGDLIIQQYVASRKFVKFNINSLFGSKSEALISIQAESAGDPW